MVKGKIIYYSTKMGGCAPPQKQVGPPAPPLPSPMPYDFLRLSDTVHGLIKINQNYRD